jgi:hypothetical protein
VVRDDLRREVGRAGATESWGEIRQRLGLDHEDRPVLEAMVSAGEVGMVGDRYFPSRWART